MQDALVRSFEVLPTPLTRGPGSSPYCAGTMNQGTVMLEIDRQPAAGASFRYLVGCAPPSTLGAIGLSFGPPLPICMPIGGACLALGPSPVFLFLMSGPLGEASLPLFVPPGWRAPMLGIHAQAIWLVPPPRLQLTSSATVF